MHNLIIDAYLSGLGINQELTRASKAQMETNLANLNQIFQKSTSKTIKSGKSAEKSLKEIKNYPKPFLKFYPEELEV